MVSSLWKAAAEGDLEKVRELTPNADAADLEIKDHTGATPLIQAVRGNHLEVVKVLLAKGADPNNESSQGRPDAQTSNPEILEALAAARASATPNGLVTAAPEAYEQNNGQNPEGATAQFYYYPPPPPVGPDGAYVRYYEGAEGAQLAHGGPNMPPPDIARTIPCRYYPACRYGSSCMFAHPQPPYFAGPPPPPHYGPPYDQAAHPGHFSGPYYPVPFHPAGGPPPPPQIVIPGSSTMSPPQPLNGHHRSASDVLSPQSAPFSPSSSLPSALPYHSLTPVSPAAYSPGLPPPPHGPSPIHGPVHGQAPPQPSHSHPHPPPVYPIVLPPPVPYPPMHAHQRRDSVGAYAQPGAPGGPLPVPGPPFDRQRKTSNADADQDVAHFRGDAGRRGGFGRRLPAGRKPPCMFFPSGKCRNGDDCRFPHILPEHPPTSYGNGVGAPPPSRFNGRRVGPNDEPKHDFEVKYHEKQANGTLPTRPFLGPGAHRPFDKALKNGMTNGHIKPQRIPNADDFPSLTDKGSRTTTPPQGNGYHKVGLTAAQVLKDPAPPKKVKDAFRTATSSESSRSGNQTPDTIPSPREGHHMIPHTDKPVLVNGINSVPKTSNHSALQVAPSTVEVSA